MDFTFLQKTSFPRKRESIAARLRGKTHTLAIASRWIPACAGMTMVMKERIA
jgi:hypothetical protein